MEQFSVCLFWTFNFVLWECRCLGPCPCQTACPCSIERNQCSNGISLNHYRFFKALVNKEDLDNFRQEIDRMYRQIYIRMCIYILDANDRKKAPLSRRSPEHAGEYTVKLVYSIWSLYYYRHGSNVKCFVETVGVKEPTKEIIDLLE